jgi:hypothetical protein
MSDEGWQIFQGLEHNGYQLAGKRLPIDQTDVSETIKATEPTTVVMQDKREWDVAPTCFRDQEARFNFACALAERSDIFKLTILKDAHQRPVYHAESAREIGCHAWICYYHPRIVKHLAPYVREQHLIRTYHSLDPGIVPPVDKLLRLDRCLLSGATSSAYPLRQRLFREVHALPGCMPAAHPGYHRNGCATPQFLKRLVSYKVAICTSSIYGYALRKFCEATACGCRIVTDLPTDEVLPEIDENLVRIHPSMPTTQIGDIIQGLYKSYDMERQKALSQKAIAFYDYRAVTKRLADDIERLRQCYN